MNFKQLLFLCAMFFIFCTSFLHAKNNSIDTVKVGIYVMSIHDIDFKQKEYAINFWLWFRYKNPDLNFYQNVEIPQAKSVNKSYFSTDTLEDGSIYMLMKMQCVMKDSWKIDNFPFDKQKLRLSIENSEADSSVFMFDIDSVGSHYGKFTISGWVIDSFNLNTGFKKYETAFGLQSTEINPSSTYSTFKLKIAISRNAWGLFWKMFLGMYIAFLIAHACFFIHADNIDSRFGLSVGALFAVIGNKYVIDSSLPETSTFTLVDTLHGLTLLFILCSISFSVYALKLNKNNKLEKANRIDKIGGSILLALYVIANLYFILSAMYS